MSSGGMFAVKSTCICNVEGAYAGGISVGVVTSLEYTTVPGVEGVLLRVSSACSVFGSGSINCPTTD